MSQLIAWYNFYVIVGSSSGALIGLTFVAITLIGNLRERGTSQAVGAFTTPTVVHFAAVLFVCAVLSAPWPALLQPGVVLVLAGLYGVGYTAIVMRRLLRQELYHPVPEDWLWYAVCPLVAYIALLVAAVLLPASPEPALFVMAAVMLLLLFVSVHNAWDAVTYIVVERYAQEKARDEQDMLDEPKSNERTG